MTTMAESLLRGLKANGARQLFGIPGDFALPFFKVIEQSGILPLFTLSHEPGVGFAADAAARSGDGIGVAVVTYGAGAFNMVNPVACAYAEKSPLVVISGAPGVAEGQDGLLLHHQAKTLSSQQEMFKEITCDQAILTDPRTAHADIARVLQSCREQSRPVYIEFPRDLVDAPCEEVPLLQQTPGNPEAVTACAQEVLQRIAAANAPLILAGVEVRRYGLEAKVAELSRRLRLPVATTFMGRGLFSNTPCELIGSYIGIAGDPEVSRSVEESDQLLMLGVILCDTNFGVSSKRLDIRNTVNASDRQVKVGYHQYPQIPLSELVDQLLVETASVAEHRPATPPDYPRDLCADNAPIQPTDIARAVNDLFAQRGPMPIASDMGDCLFTAMDMENTHLVAPGYYATMGFGVPAGIGLQAELGQRPIILVGDGAFQMTGWELGNCRRYGLDPIVLLFNNCCWGMLATFQPETHFNTLDDWQFASMASAMGGDGTRVSTRAELEHALKKAVETTDRFQLIEIMMTPEARSSTLQHFVDAHKKRSGMGQ
ncbi:indolepyruvate/phenylpyruvate decarboxylase [Aestuariirhabdus litorea]|uniref:Indolepyruvate/phenylpyruvate decarboxylase n=1 Tax=Aestuariirhabdus litorea TaxID=2528527 RepID=A0A3P3VVR8_9GAMM|nr:indolepyruvate/phenylpyruvate decarboxylase [Aestuariirhabdus litorea]RRJ84833.1 indolepyruvate/phenylpyruvate decarboxylase [Aestuariirhabdus litorea]RWW98058.1 indolepyruvate/phenylpyruvate decarboxylase [Endozoicomonadaceae bacterium GTF-13]